MANAPRIVPTLLSLEDALLALDSTPDRCALLDSEGRIARVNLPWTREPRSGALFGAASLGVGIHYLAACAGAAIGGNRRAGTMHAQLKRVLDGEVERVRLDFERPCAKGGVDTTTVTIERVLSEEGDHVLVSFATKGVYVAQPTSIPEAGFAVPSGARIERLATALDSLSTHAAILDPLGRIVAVNAAWRHFSAANGGRDARTNEGASYLAVCHRATQRGDQRARIFGDGLKAVLRGERHTFHVDCRMGGRGEAPRRYRGRVTALALESGRFALVTYTELAASAPAQSPSAQSVSAPDPSAQSPSTQSHSAQSPPTQGHSTQASPTQLSTRAKAA